MQAQLEPLNHITTDAVTTLKSWSNINSGSYNLAGLHQMHQTIKQQFSALSDDIYSFKGQAYDAVDLQGHISQQQTGQILSLKKRWQQTNTNILLCGHMDTVFGENHTFQSVVDSDNGILVGPGVADMKGGLLVIFYALKAIESSPYAKNIGWQILINADEETGSLGSQAALENAAKQADVGLVFEPATTPDGIFAGKRKGSGKFSIIVEGRAAHAGRAFYDGRNAICHLSAIVTELHALNDPSAGLTANVGLFHGGEALNVVPDRAVAKIDVRFETIVEQQRFYKSLTQIIEKYNDVDGYQVKLHGAFSRPPKPMCPKTLQLFNLLKSVGNALNQDISWQATGGCCDGNNLSACGLPVIDTLGVRGGNIHSDKEFMIIDSIVERAKLTTALLIAIANGQLEG